MKNDSTSEESSVTSKAGFCKFVPMVGAGIALGATLTYASGTNERTNERSMASTGWQAMKDDRCAEKTTFDQQVRYCCEDEIFYDATCWLPGDTRCCEESYKWSPYFDNKAKYDDWGVVPTVPTCKDRCTEAATLCDFQSRCFSPQRGCYVDNNGGCYRSNEDEIASCLPACEMNEAFFAAAFEEFKERECDFGNWGTSWPCGPWV